MKYEKTSCPYTEPLFFLKCQKKRKGGVGLYGRPRHPLLLNMKN